MTILPSIDLRGGQVVRLKQGDYQRQLTYAVDPFQTAAAFAAAGAQWMHLVDLDGAQQGRPVQTDLIARLAASTKLNVQVGGGVRESRDIDRLLDAGAARVVVGTRAMEDWKWFSDLAHDQRYAGKIVLALDARDGMVAMRAWTSDSGKKATDVAAAVRAWPLAAILYTDVARDGMMQGPNFLQTRRLAESTDVPVIASGGVGTLDHVLQLLALPVWGAIIGRSLYEGKVDLAEAIRIARS